MPICFVPDVYVINDVHLDDVISDKGVAAVVQGCARIRQLSVTSCQRITDSSIKVSLRTMCMHTNDCDKGCKEIMTCLCRRPSQYVSCWKC